MRVPLESWRIRDVNIFYYLEDSTVMITENKQENSGVPQGTFLKRQMVLKTGLPIGEQAALDTDDFKVGETVNIYGRNFMLTDADQYTREFYSNLGIEQGEAQEVPTDSFSKSQNKS